MLIGLKKDVYAVWPMGWTDLKVFTPVWFDRSTTARIADGFWVWSIPSVISKEILKTHIKLVNRKSCAGCNFRRFFEAEICSPRKHRCVFLCVEPYYGFYGRRLIIQRAFATSWFDLSGCYGLRYWSLWLWLSCFPWRSCSFTFFFVFLFFMNFMFAAVCASGCQICGVLSEKDI